jgi:LysR family glycine cleavage system transcriptional activator
MPQRLPPLLALRAFEAAGRHLSFTVAASELCLTQGAISRQVRHLEDFLQQKLFLRLTRRVELTDVGREYLEAVQQALGVVEVATRKCLRHEHRVLTIDVLPTLGALWLMPRLARFSNAYPNIEVRFITSIEPANLQNKDVDMAIRVGRLPGKRYASASPRVDLQLALSWQGVEVYPLFDDVLVPVMSRELAQQGSPISGPRDLLQYRLINNATRKSAWKDWLAAQNIGSYDSSKSTDYGHFFMTLQAAKEGQGVALIPKAIFENIAPSDGLFCPLHAQVPSAGEYYLLTKESTQNDPAVAAMREWLLSEAAELAAKIDGDGESNVTPPSTPAPTGQIANLVDLASVRRGSSAPTRQAHAGERLALHMS